MTEKTGAKIAEDIFNFKELRPVPYWLFGLTQWEGGIAGKIDDYYGNRDWRSGLSDTIDAYHVGFIKEALEDGTIMDTFGVTLDAGNIFHVKHHPITQPNLDGFRWPDPEGMIDWDSLKTHFDRFEDRIRLCGLAMGLFERSWFLRGFENVMIDMIDNPDFFEELLDHILQIHLEVMELIIERFPIDAYYGGDDVSDQRSIMMGMDHWRKFFKPRLKKMIDHCHSLGYPFVLHACGNVMPLIDDLIEIGLDGLESLQSESNDVFWIKQKAKGKLILIGGMGVQSTLFRGTPEEVYNETQKLLKELGQGGGYIVAPSKPFACEPVENIAAFIDAITKQ